MITSTTRAQNALNAILANVNSGGNAGSLRIFSGTPPGSLITPPGVQLAHCGQLTPASAAFGNATFDGTVVKAIGTTTGGKFAEDTSADAPGTASYFRVYDSAGNAVYQGTVGATGSGADLELNTTAIVATARITITSCDPRLTGIY